VDASGDIFIPDTYNNRVRRVDGETGIIRTMAGEGTGGDGGPAKRALLGFPASLALDRYGNLFIDDGDADRIRRVDAGTADISTVAGNGIFVWGVSNDVPATTTGLHWPFGLAVDRSGNLFISDTWANVIRRVDADTGIITTVAGGGSTLGDGGPATSAAINQPYGVAVDEAGNLFIGDTGDNRVRRVDAVTGIITTVAGTGTWGYSGDGGLATAAKLSRPRGVAVDKSGNVFFSDSGNYRIRRVDAATGIITTVAGNGTYTYSGDGGLATNAGIGFLEQIALDPLGNLFLGSQLVNPRIRRVDAFTGTITTVAGNGTAGFEGDGGSATNAELNDPIGIAVDPFGDMFIGDGANNRVRKLRLPPYPVFSPMNVTFLAQAMGTTSKPQVITLTNTGTAPLDISEITIGGANAEDFAETDSCAGRVESGESCQISVTFTPKRPGTRTVALTITDNAPDSPRTVALSGTGST
jgi:streptogramin lyase